jgi:S-formylglutathione hydrolase FrmB
MRSWFVTVAVLAVSVCGGPPVAQASPAAGATVERIEQLTPARAAMWVRSPAMGRSVQVQILHPVAGGARSSFYLLDGSEADDQENMWTMKTDIVRFFAGKNVNVVLPVGGRGSYYTDWQRPDPVLGVNMWETFLTKELPPLVNANFHGNGVNAIGGLSMGGEAALILATRNPELYRAVTAYSVCPDTTNYAPVVQATVRARGGNPDDMWGPMSNAAWRDHDALIHADKLRGKAMYLAVGNGVPSPGAETLSPAALAAQLTTGTAIEWVARRCTQDFQLRLESLHILATFNYRNIGSHSWPYWQGDLHDSWPTVAAALRP